MLEGLSVEALGMGGTVLAVIIALVLWKLLKLALRAAVFVAVVVALVLGIGAYVKGGRLPLPIGAGADAGSPSAPG